MKSTSFAYSAPRVVTGQRQVQQSSEVLTQSTKEEECRDDAHQQKDLHNRVSAAQQEAVWLRLWVTRSFLSFAFPPSPPDSRSEPIVYSMFTEYLL